MALAVNVSSSWKYVKQAYVNVNNSWKAVRHIYILIAHGNLYIHILGGLEIGVIVVYLVEEVLKQDL